MNSQRLRLCAMLLLFVPLVAGAVVTKPTCAILTFDAKGGVSKDEASLLTDRFSIELDKTGAYLLTPREKLGEVLQEQKFSRSDNCSATDCAIEAGKLLGAQFMVYGSLGRVGSTYTVNAYVVNVENGATVKTANYDMRAEVDDLLTRGMAAVVRKLLGLPVQEETTTGSNAARQIYAGKPRTAVVQQAAPSSPEPVARPASQKPGRTMSLDLGGGIKMPFMEIPAGEFVMGSPVNERSHPEQGPQHVVRISHGFWMGQYEVTVGEFRRFVAESGYRTAAEIAGWTSVWNGSAWVHGVGVTWLNARFAQTDRHPVVSLSWADAKAFCRWLSSRTGRPCRLPTEAEWEYACRAGTITRYNTGDTVADLDRAGWYDANSGNMTHPVGMKHPNAWGLYDMHGNATEYCEDYFRTYRATPETDPIGAMRQNGVGTRGSSFYLQADTCRSGMRGRNGEEFMSDCCGLRVVVTDAKP